MMTLSSTSGETRDEESDLAFRASLMSASWLVLGNNFIYVKQKAGLSCYRDWVWSVREPWHAVT